MPFEFRLGLLAQRHIHEDAGELPRSGAIGEHLVVTFQRCGVVLEMDRYARQGHLAVGGNPVWFDCRQDLGHQPADHILPPHAGELFECRVDVEKAVIGGHPPVVADDLVEGEPLGHVLEQGVVPLLALAQRRLGLLEVSEHQGIGFGEAGLDDRLVDEVEGDDLQVMADQVGKVEDAQVEGKGQLGADRRHDRQDKQGEHIAVELLLFFEQQEERGQQNDGNRVLADDLEPGQSAALDMTVREVAAEYGRQQQCRYHGIPGEDGGRAQFPSDRERRRQQRTGGKGAGGDPELGRQVRSVSFEYAHPLVGKGVDEVDAGDEEIGDTDEHQVVVVDDPPGIPGQQEEAEPDDDAVQLGKHVEEGVAVPADDVQPHQGDDTDSHLTGPE